MTDLRLALYQPDIPGNTGTILRLAACLGFGVDLIEPAGFDISDRNLKRSGMDYLAMAALTRHVNFDRFEEWRATTGRRLILASTKASNPYTSFAFRPDDILLFGADKLAVLIAGGQSPAIKEVAAFESQIDKIYPSDVVAGDLNGDGHVDLAIIDIRNHFIEIVQYRPKKGLEHALYFRVYEQKSFRNDDETKDAEPREALIADVTGDGLADLILLAHDRLLVYPQDDGK